MLSRLVDALHKANLEMTAEEIADTVWLALQMQAQQGTIDAGGESDAPAPRLAEEASEPLSGFPAVSSHAQPEHAATVHLPAQRPSEESTPHLSGMPFRSPAGSALPNSLALVRALRPLKRRVPSKTSVRLNEQATAQHIAETQARLWTPIFDPAPIRWFDLELVVDSGPSLSLWKEMIGELSALLAGLGAFRNIRLWQLATDQHSGVSLYAGTRAQEVQGHTRHPNELVNPGADRLILVVSDGVAPAWHSGKVQEQLQKWGEHHLVTVLHVFPLRLWSQTALGAAEMVQIAVCGPGRANTHFTWWQSLVPWVDERSSAKQPLPLPLVTCEPRSLASWVQVITGRKNAWMTGVLLEQNPNGGAEEPLAEQDVNDLSPQQRVQQFRSTASSLARRLAGLLAAAPVPMSLAVIRQIQQTMIPEASQVHVAEVLLGGLLEALDGDGPRHPPDQIEYDFVAGVRDELVNTVPIPDAHRVLSVLSAFVREHYGQPRDFPAVLATPKVEHQGTTISATSRSFAQIDLRALRRFGGAFVSLINALEQQADSKEEPQDERSTQKRIFQTIADPSQHYAALPSREAVSPDTSSMGRAWCGFDWTVWLPLNSSAIVSEPGVYRVRAIGGDELVYIGITGRSLKTRIGDLYRNIVRDPTQMPFTDPHVAAPALWAWRDASGVDFECSAISLSPQEDLEALVHYLLWEYRLEKGHSTLANHGRFHPHYTKSSERKTRRRGYRFPDGQVNPAGGPSWVPLPLVATPAEQTWMGLAWSDLTPLHSTSLQHIVSSCGVYKILDADTAQLLFIGFSKNLRTMFQSQLRKKWGCPNPAFAFATLPETILPHQLQEVENDLLGGYYAYKKAAPKFQFGNHKDEEEALET